MTSEPNLLPRALSLAVHEFRTPVTVVAGYLRMLLREQAGPISDKQRTMLEEADRSCARIATLISEMSELGKLEAGEIAVPGVAFDLAALVTELAGNMHGAEDRGIRLDVRAARPVMVRGDRTRLAAALTAMMQAVLRERGEPGVITVECSMVPDTTPVWGVVAVGDAAATSSLIAAARDAATAPFDEWRGGLGLALPVGRRVVEAHGGAIWSAEQPRGGSALRLPAAS